jgi:hypothetical protein
MAAYALLIGAAFVLLHGKILYATLILFAGLAVKTVAADRLRR